MEAQNLILLVLTFTGTFENFNLSHIIVKALKLLNFQNPPFKDCSHCDVTVTVAYLT